MNSPLIDPACTQMFREAAAAGAVVRLQLERNRVATAELGERLRRDMPRTVVTCARGSSDHAATYAKYVFETRCGVVTSSAAPSVASVYGVKPDLRDCLFLTISQSGMSPDLIAAAAGARAAGATVVALVNNEDSPLADEAHYTVPLCAGAETSVAATKSYIASLAAIAHLVAELTLDAELHDALMRAPEDLERAWALDWSAAVERLRAADHLFVIARGVGLTVAQEAALKCKETSGLHAESFSAAEVRHGPQALLDEGFPALLLAQRDETHAGMAKLAAELAARGVDAMVAGAPAPGALELPTVESHALVEPLLLAQAFYRFVNALAIARGRDPDRPPHLAKVTRTT